MSKIRPGKNIKTPQSKKAIIMGIRNFFFTLGKAILFMFGTEIAEAKEIAKMNLREKRRKRRLIINRV